MKLHISDDLSLPLEAVTQTFAILAKRGVGKTYTGCVMAEEILSAGQQIVIIDPVGVWWGLRSSADGKSEGYKIVVFGGEHADVPLEEHSGEIIAGAIIENGFSAILDLSLLRKGAQVRFMTAFAETLYRLNRKPLHLMVDEADAFCPQRPQHDEARLLGAFEDIVRRGRARGLGVTLITQRAAVINKNVLTQIEVLVCLRTIAPQDREAIEAWIEVHGTQKQRDEMLSHLASLPIGTAYFWSPGWLDIFKKVAIRKRTTFDSSVTPKVGEKVVAPKAIAAVDLEQLGEQIKSTVEKSKANDPAELKREIARLKKAALNPVQQKAEIKEVSIFTKEDRESIGELNVQMMSVYSEMKDAERFDEAAKLFERFLSKTTISTPPLRPTATNLTRVVVRAKSPMVSTPSNENGESPTGGLRRMLIALAQRPGLSARQLGVRSGLSSTSGSFNTYLSKGRTNGWLVGDRNGMEVTESGLSEIGHYQPLPEGKALLDYWLNQLGNGGAGRILLALSESHPNSVSKQDLGEITSLSSNSGSFNTYLSKLRTLELIEGSNPIKASDEFFI